MCENTVIPSGHSETTSLPGHTAYRSQGLPKVQGRGLESPNASMKSSCLWNPKWVMIPSLGRHRSTCQGPEHSGQPLTLHAARGRHTSTCLSPSRLAQGGPSLPTPLAQPQGMEHMRPVPTGTLTAH